MSQKKDKDPNKKFNQNPFKELRGFCVSEAQDKSLPGSRQSKPPDKTSVSQGKAEPQPVDEDVLFAEEMDRLGMPARAAEDQDEELPESAPVEQQPITRAPQSDTDLFLETLGQMDAVFTDGQPTPEIEGQATPRRMKLLRQGRLVPEDRLDLHGLNREDARSRVRYFLENALFHGRKTVLIITGRGKGSGGEPVLRKDVEKYLSFEAKAWVSEWARAPRQYGGEGALVVFLKTKKA